MSAKKLTKEEYEFIKEQCILIDAAFEEVQRNMLNMINSIEDEETREKFMKMYNDKVDTEKLRKYRKKFRATSLKIVPCRIKNKANPTA